MVQKTYKLFKEQYFRDGFMLLFLRKSVLSLRWELDSFFFVQFCQSTEFWPIINGRSFYHETNFTLKVWKVWNSVPFVLRRGDWVFASYL